jgi:hypothetical protein
MLFIIRADRANPITTYNINFKVLMTFKSPTPVFDADTLLGFIPPRVFRIEFDFHRPLTLLDVNFLSGFLLTAVASGYLLDRNDFSLSSQREQMRRVSPSQGFPTFSTAPIKLRTNSGLYFRLQT